jgi:leader peptidase (prepilin peptidase)/N-methyltransferase
MTIFPTAFTYFSIAIIAFLIGIIINTYMCWIPHKLQHQWQQQAQVLLGQTTVALPYPSLSLNYKTWLHQTCHACGTQPNQKWLYISGLTCVLSLLIVAYFGLHWATLANLALMWGLLLLAGIDSKYYLLPDALTLALLWLGLLLNTHGLFVPLQQAVTGCAVGYLSLWLVAYLFERYRGVAGLGQGDVKLFALFGAWWGPAPLLYLLLIASISGVAVGGVMLWRRKQHYQQALPFGPYLAASGLIMMFLRERIC